MKNIAWLNFSGSLKDISLINIYGFVFPANIDYLLIHRRNEAAFWHYQDWVRSGGENLKNE